MKFSANVWAADDAGRYRPVATVEDVEADTHAFAAELVWITMTHHQERPMMTVGDVIVITDEEEDAQAHQVEFIGTALVEHPRGKHYGALERIEADEDNTDPGATVRSGQRARGLRGQDAAPSLDGAGQQDGQNRGHARRKAAGRAVRPRSKPGV